MATTPTKLELREHRAATLRLLLHFHPAASSLPITVPPEVITDLVRDRLIFRAGVDKDTKRAAYRLRNEPSALAALDGGENLFSSFGN